MRKNPMLRSKASRIAVSADYKVCETGIERERFFVAQIPFSKGGVSFREVREGGDDGPLLDILDVKIEGYASTFNNLDRDGEKFLPGAFEEDLANFMRNPVMLKDHWNKCDNVVGNFTKVHEDKKGLFVKGVLSNAPDVRSIRFKVAEGMIRTFSVAGMFHFNETHVEIFRAHLYEISLIPIPANPKALFDFIKGHKISSDDEAHRTQLLAGSSEAEEKENLKTELFILPGGLRVAV